MNDAASQQGLSRRNFLSAAGGVALAAGALAGCGGGGSSSGTSTSSGNAVLPQYVPRKLPVTPTYPAHGIVPAGYTTVPPEYNAYHGVPGSGGTVTLFSPLYGTPITPEGSNPWWKAINKAMGVDLHLQQVPDSAYLTKQQAAIASGNLPDVMTFITQLPNFADLMEHDFADLTPMLSGKGIRKYPNLAGLPTYAWKNSMLDGRIMGVPLPLPVANTAFFYRSDILAKSSTPHPSNADEFMAMAKDVTNSRAGVWAIGSRGQGTPNTYMHPFFAMMWGVPNNWKVDKSGKFTSWIESPQWLDTLSYMQKLYKAGVYNPGSLTTDDSKNLFSTGKIVIYQDGIQAAQGSGGLMSVIKRTDPKGTMDIMAPPGHDGGTGTYWNTPGLLGQFSAIRKGSKDHTEEMLRLMDFCAAPTFSTQSNLLSYGVKGVDYKIVNGRPVATAAAENKGGANGFMALPPLVYVSVGTENVVEMQYKFSEVTAKIGVDDPSLGLYSATNARVGENLTNNVVNPAIQAIVRGESVSSWSGILSQWKSQGGTMIRSELEKAYAEQKGHH